MDAKVFTMYSGIYSVRVRSKFTLMFKNLKNEIQVLG